VHGLDRGLGFQTSKSESIKTGLESGLESKTGLEYYISAIFAVCPYFTRIAASSTVIHHTTNQVMRIEYLTPRYCGRARSCATETISIENSTNGATTLCRINVYGHVAHVTIFS